MGQNKETEAARAKRFAEIFVYEHPGNIAASYRQLQSEMPPKQTPTTTKCRNQNFYRYFQKPMVQKYIAQEREKAQEAYDIRKDEIVANLQQIAFDESSKPKDRLAALKQLTDLGGLTTQNVNLQAKADLEVVIE